MTRDEQQITREFIGGNHRAFELLYNQYSDAVYANIRKMVRVPNLAEDILQDVFTALWTNRAKIDPAQSIANWLFVVSYHKSLTSLKKKLRENCIPADEIALAEIPEDPEFDEKYYGAQIHILNTAVENLPLHKQKVFRLYHFENKSFEEIAQELNLSVSSVKFYLKQSRSFIRKYVSDHFPQTVGLSLLLLVTIP
ncbi:MULTISPECIES: RNA polymerase sigma factor [Niastella]|uniref:Sigma-70 family RNA polymerase sigma factor n=1 Tax=Niastella soli TaxID=2821487 RepID=A0ABS3YLE4_9BACT|nr:sigma-70 family RNA polymerase sigma factor [Niastella soli]MBO9198709.1 sigma-70 family RNA polymerase sigma factor [Niastella soli]